MYYGLADARISASEKDLPVEKMHIFLYSKFCYAFASVNDFGALKNYVHIYRLFFFRSTIHFTIQTKMLQRDCTYKNSTYYCFVYITIQMPLTTQKLGFEQSRYLFLG